MAKATTWTDTDTEVRKRGANRLDTLVVHAVNDVDQPGILETSGAANAISRPPEYGRKVKTQMN